MSLFELTLRSLIREAPNQQKAKLLQIMFNEMSLNKRPITIVLDIYSKYFIPTLLLREILLALNPNLLDRNFTDFSYWSTHPYILQIVETIGHEAFTEYDRVYIYKMNLALYENYKVAYIGYGEHAIDSYITDKPYECLIQQCPHQGESLKSSKEVEEIIQKVLKDNNTEINSANVVKWLKEHTIFMT